MRILPACQPDCASAAAGLHGGASINRPGTALLLLHPALHRAAGIHPLPHIAWCAPPACLQARCRKAGVDDYPPSPDRLPWFDLLAHPAQWRLDQNYLQRASISQLVELGKMVSWQQEGCLNGQNQTIPCFRSCWAPSCLHDTAAWPAHGPIAAASLPCVRGAAGCPTCVQRRQSTQCLHRVVLPRKGPTGLLLHARMHCHLARVLLAIQ